MAKRIAVKYVGNIQSCCSNMRYVPEGTAFKAVESLDNKGRFQGVWIRGSNLTKACRGKHKFNAKQYLFIINKGSKHNAMEVIHES
jgi:hypothetical protein